jgi:hypothetical protein
VDGEQRRDEAIGTTDDAGGDPACWAALLCPNCGAVPDSPGASVCPRCGEPYPVDE